MQNIDKRFSDRFRGSLIGLAVGDALGMPVEFRSPGTFKPITDMRDGGSFGLDAGEWTDDTSMALCLAESLIDKKGFDPTDQMERYVEWYRNGHLSVNGKCFDIGNTTFYALHQFEKTKEPYCGPDYERSAGNGSLMRLAPVPLFYSSNPEKAIEFAGLSSRTTHQHPLTIDACRYMAGIIVGALVGDSKKDILGKRYCPIPKYWEENPLVFDIDEIACGSFKERNPPEVRGSGFVVKSLEAALWAFYNTDDFETGCLKVVNLGDDADTTGAIYGQIAGTYYGESGIPKKWRDKLAKLDLLNDMVDNLMKISNEV